MRTSIPGSLWSPCLSVFLLGLIITAPLRAQEILLKDATVLTVTRGTIREGDVLIRDGKIAAVGRNLKASKEAKVISLKGKYVMPGMVDTHVHLAIEGGVNEATETVSAEVDIGDVINEKDTSIRLNLARGVTTVNAMHGSANPIGGLTQTLKMRWGRSAEELKFEGARKHIKFALGENPKRVHQDRGIASRLGVADTYRQRLTAAREYMRDWEEYRRKMQAGESVIPPRKDLELENLAAVLRGEIWVQCHSYRAEEIEMLMKLSDEFGFKIGAFQHVLEGYKIAPEMAKRNIGASTFADNWGYKVEAYDGISFNAAAMTQWGVRASLNTDWPVLRIGLNYEAAKSLRYGGLSDDQCLALVTINPAWQLGIDHRIGSIEVGKDADISVWEGHPLSVYSRCVMTLIDGQIYFERKADGTSVFGVPAPPSAPPANAPATSAAANSAPQPAAENKPTIPASSFVPLQLPTSTALNGSATFALTDARIVTVSGPVIEQGTILVENGRIKAVGRDVTVPSGVRVVNARGLSVYPGFINAATTLGLTEISSVQETQDLGERGAMKAQLRAADAYNTHSAWIGVARCAGITAALVSPRGSGWMGQSALMRTAGRTVEEATVVGEAAQALSLSGAPGTAAPPSGGEPVFAPSGSAAPAQTSPLSVREQVERSLSEAREFAQQWEAYRRGADPSARPPRENLLLQAIIPVVRKERPVILSANQPDDIEQAVQFGVRNDLRVIITGGSEADRAAAVLNRYGVPVIYTGLFGGVGGNDSYDRHFSAPKRIFDAGIKFCIATSASSNLTLHAGLAAAYGLPKEEALKAITLYPAQILGVGKDLGSIEVGKIADLILTDGDPLEYRTKIRRMFIGGVEVPLVSRHSQLYEQFRKK